MQFESFSFQTLVSIPTRLKAMLVFTPLFIFGFALLPCVTLVASLVDCTPGLLPINSTLRGSFFLRVGSFYVAVRHEPQTTHSVAYLSPIRPGPLFELKDGNLTTLTGGLEAYWGPVPLPWPPVPVPLLFGKAVSSSKP